MSDGMDRGIFTVSETKRKHELVTLIALRKIPQLRLPGRPPSTVEENTKFETYRWFAEDLIAAGLAQFAVEEKPLDLVELQKIHFRETIQTTRRLAEVPAGFYTDLCVCLRSLKTAASQSRERLLDYEKAAELAMDIVTSRLNKVLSIASIRDPTETTLENLTPEELRLYTAVHKNVEGWRLELMRQLEGCL